MLEKLTTQVDIWVFLPPEFEFHDRLEEIFNTACYQYDAKETSTIGPCIKFENTNEVAAKVKVMLILGELGFL